MRTVIERLRRRSQEYLHATVRSHSHAPAPSLNSISLAEVRRPIDTSRLLHKHPRDFTVLRCPWKIFWVHDFLAHEAIRQIK